MATFDAAIHVQAFEHMEAGRKTVYVLPCSEEYDFISSGDRVEFGSLGAITVGMVRRYPSLESLFAAEGWQNVVPDARDADQAAQAVRSAPEWSTEVEQHRGVLALRVREARRKI